LAMTMTTENFMPTRQSAPWNNGKLVTRSKSPPQAPSYVLPPRIAGPPDSRGRAMLEADHKFILWILWRCKGHLRRKVVKKAICSAGQLRSIAEPSADSDRRSQVVVPRKSDPSEINRCPDLFRMHVAEALAKADLRLDVDDIPNRQKASRKGHAQKRRVAILPIPGRLWVGDKDLCHMCFNLWARQHRDSAVTVAAAKVIVTVPGHPTLPLLRSCRAAFRGLGGENGFWEETTHKHQW
jgi:hypothetical protein